MSMLGLSLAISAICARSSVVSERVCRFFSESRNFLSAVRAVSAVVAVRLRVGGRSVVGLTVGIRDLRICCSRSTFWAGAVALPASRAAATNKDPAAARLSVTRIVAIASLHLNSVAASIHLYRAPGGRPAAGQTIDPERVAP